jgi:hypothetical protein
VEDYLSSGLTVVGIVGVDASPSCGVRQTLDLTRSLDLIGCLPKTAHAGDMNAIVEKCVVEGTGNFIHALQQELRHRKLNVPFLAHDLIAEIQGEPISFNQL